MEPERIEFPTEYPIKVVVRSEAALRERIDAIFAGHFGPLAASQVTERPSAQGNFLSITYVPRVEREEQLRALHAELSVLDGVMMVI
jgi:putative lipoic acid-binding regulatory protein